jgi:uncharacterized protein YndB with AHSA1/START domain
VARYAFLTTWLLAAERERVWEAIHATERWPEWWRGVVRVTRVREGDGDGAGAVWDHEWRSVLPYPVRFRIETIRVERYRLIEGRADGELRGTGRWRLWSEGGLTAVTYEWNVATTRRWMNLLAPLARPVFEWNHDWVMRRGGEGLARLLAAELLAAG